jgi:hypothetical protein
LTNPMTPDPNMPENLLVHVFWKVLTCWLTCVCTFAFKKCWLTHRHADQNLHWDTQTHIWKVYPICG